MRLLYVDVGHTTYYGIRDSKFRKFLERPFPTPPGHHRLSMGQGFVAQPCDSRSENFPRVLLGRKKNSAYVETTTRLRFPLKFVVDMRHI
jgi:hypothetical protein